MNEVKATVVSMDSSDPTEITVGVSSFFNQSVPVVKISAYEMNPM